MNGDAVLCFGVLCCVGGEQNTNEYMTIISGLLIVYGSFNYIKSGKSRASGTQWRLFARDLSLTRLKLPHGYLQSIWDRHSIDA